MIFGLTLCHISRTAIYMLFTKQTNTQALDSIIPEEALKQWHLVISQLHFHEVHLSPK